MSKLKKNVKEITPFLGMLGWLGPDYITWDELSPREYDLSPNISFWPAYNAPMPLRN
jgi:hypothetical protein